MLIPVSDCQLGSLFLIICKVVFVVTKCGWGSFCYYCFYVTLLLLLLILADSVFACIFSVQAYPHGKKFSLKKFFIVVDKPVNFRVSAT